MKALQKILNEKLVGIIRGFETEDALSIAKALSEGGVNIFEITLNSSKPFHTIERVTDELGDKALVGAGTVLDPESARSALAAGAQFILSPTVNLETIKLTKRYGAVSIPGAFTPTEILTAYEEGGDIIKVFPASTLGPSFVKDIKGPLDQIKLLPTGGVNLKNVSEYIQAGVAGVGLGSSLVNKTEKVSQLYLNKLTENARQFVEAIKK